MSARGHLLDLPAGPGGAEVFDTLFDNGAVRVERIVSHGQASPPGFWYDQPADEWVMVVRGDAVVAFDDGRQVALRTGDWLTIPAHRRHRVESTGPDTVWLAVHAATAAPAA